MIGELNELVGLLQPWCFYDSMIQIIYLCLEVCVTKAAIDFTSKCFDSSPLEEGIQWDGSCMKYGELHHYGIIGMLS